jgi:hypothetical protein
LRGPRGRRGGEGASPVSTRQWTAERWNAEFAAGKRAAVTLNIANLHLDALRAYNAERVEATREGKASLENANLAEKVTSRVKPLPDRAESTGDNGG